MLNPSEEAPLTIHFSDTGNSVSIEPPERVAASEPREFGVLAEIRLHVERDCTDKEGQDLTFINCRRLRIPTDAGRAFWLFIETISETELRKNNFVPGYPISPAEEIQDNPLVRTCHYEWVYNGLTLGRWPLGAVPSISISRESWREAASRLARVEHLPPYMSFVLA